MSNSNQKITALYCRLSQEDMKDGESVSIENQRFILQKYADDHGFLNCKFYIDDGYSGANFNRPAFKEMMAEVENKNVSAVIVKDQSRLGRDYLQTGMLMEVTFPQYDVRFIAINDGVDSANGTSDYAGIRNYFNDLYARDTNRKIRAVQRAKGERGERVGTKIPYGYMKNPDDPKQLLPDPETAPIVKRIFEMYANGIGIRKICSKFCEEQILSPSAYALRKTGRKTRGLDMDKPYYWEHGTVRFMLSNRIYCGDTVNFQTYSKSNKLKKRIKNDDKNILIFENTHESIIDRKTFDLVQKHFESRKRPDKHGEMDKYAGYLYCGDCGKRLYLHRNKAEEKTCFMCSNYQKGKYDCTCHYIRVQILEQIVLENLRSVTAFARNDPEKFYAMAAKNGEAEAKKFMKESKHQKEQFTGRITQLDSIIRCLYEDRVTGRITPERYDSLANGYEQEQSQLKSKLSELESQIDSVNLREECIRRFMERAKEYIEMPALTPELLRTFIRRIEVYEKPEKYSRTCGNTIVIHYTFEVKTHQI